jgi:hypothetical protein
MAAEPADPSARALQRLNRPFVLLRMPAWRSFIRQSPATQFQAYQNGHCCCPSTPGVERIPFYLLRFGKSADGMSGLEEAAQLG